MSTSHNGHDPSQSEHTEEAAGAHEDQDNGGLNKTVASANFGPFEAQLIGDYVGRRYATYLNDLWANPYFTLELEASYRFPAVAFLKAPKISLNITNLTDTKAISAFANTNASGSYTAYPLAPIQGFLTLSSTF